VPSSTKSKSVPHKILTELLPTEPTIVTEKPKPTKKVHHPISKISRATFGTEPHHKPTKEALGPKTNPTKDTNTGEEEDLLAGHVTNSTHSEVRKTQHSTEHLITTTKKPTEVKTGPKHISPTEDKEVEEDLLVGRTTMPKHQSHHITEKQVTKPTRKPVATRKKQAITEHIGKVPKETDINDEFNHIGGSKDTHSRRNRVKILEDDEDKDLLPRKVTNNKN